MGEHLARIYPTPLQELSNTYNKKELSVFGRTVGASAPLALAAASAWVAKRREGSE